MSEESMGSAKLARNWVSPRQPFSSGRSHLAVLIWPVTSAGRKPFALPSPQSAPL